MNTTVDSAAAQKQFDEASDALLEVEDATSNLFDKVYRETVEGYRAEVRKAEAIYIEINEEAKAAKKIWEGHQKVFDCYLDNPGQGQLDFPKLAEHELANPEAWRDVSVDELDLPDAIKRSLFDGGLETLGQIATHVNAGKWLTDIEGIGKAKAEKIEAATEKWHCDHPQPDTGETSDDQPDDEGDESESDD